MASANRGAATASTTARFDDAAYVATLIDLAEKLHESGTRLKRSLLFLVVTGEEKGLLGSRYFVAHPPLPRRSSSPTSTWTA